MLRWSLGIAAGIALAVSITFAQEWRTSEANCMAAIR
jgi:hypothetical protein